MDMARWHAFRTALDLLNARDANPEPLHADEVIMKISRNEYRTLLELTCEALRARCVSGDGIA